MSNNTPNSPEPTLTAASFLLSHGLYRPLDGGKLTLELVLKIRFFSGPLDILCVECGLDTTYVFGVKHVWNDYTVEKVLSFDPEVRMNVGFNEWATVKEFAVRDRYVTLQATCPRNSSHVLIYNIQMKDGFLQKIGQFPSIADISLGDFKMYRKYLPASLAGDFSRGVGLVAHGIGAGSFVYLRRVFEFLIEEAQLHALSSGQLQPTDFDN